MTRMVRNLSVMCSIALFAVLMCAMPMGAHAEDNEQSAASQATVQVTGMDSVLSTTSNDQSDGGQSVELLSVDGAKGESIYVEITQDGKTIASHLSYTLGDNQTAQSNNEGTQYSGVVTCSIKDFDPSKATYEVKAYTDRDQTQLRYDGKIQGVYAQLGEAQGSAQQLIAVRTIGDNDKGRVFHEPETITTNGATFTTTGQQLSSNPLTYIYKEDASASTLTGSITYIDDSGTVLRTETIEGITASQSQTRQIPQVITASGEPSKNATYYRTVSYNSTVEATYTGTKDFTIHCKPLTAGSDTANAQYYFASIKFVDGQGNVLAQDSLNVTKMYLYTLPDTLYLTDAQGTAHTYTLSAKNADVSKSANGANSLIAFNPFADQSKVENGERDVSVTYEEQPAFSQPWAVQLINGAADPSDTASRAIRTDSVPAGETYNVQQSIEIGGTTYVPVTSTKQSYAYDATVPVRTIYYVPEGYVKKDTYTVDVNYVNIATNEVLTTKQYTITPDSDEDMAITSPATFTQDGTQYVRLDGQDSPIMHGYFTKYRTYTVYYRDINDQRNQQTVITHLRVLYTDGTSTDGTDQGTTQLTPTTTDAGTNSNSGSTNGQTGTTSDGQTVGLNGNEDLNVVNSGDDAPVVNNEGTDTNTERIDDDETPLAAGNSQATPSSIAPIAAIIGMLIVAALVSLYVIKRKKHEQTDPQSASDAQDK